MSTSKKRTTAPTVSSTWGLARKRQSPLHPGSLFREIREGQEPLVSSKQAAARLGITQQYLNEIELGKKPVTTNVALKLEALTGVDLELWMNLQLNYDMWHALQAAKKVKRLIPGEPFPTKFTPVP